MIWTIILLIFFSDTPMNNKFISKSEKEYIMEKTKNVTFKKYRKLLCFLNFDGLKASKLNDQIRIYHGNQ